jgi:hypothetical protein
MKWMKIEYLPAVIREAVERNKKHKPETEAAIKQLKVVAGTEEKKDKETIMKEKDDFTIDYTKQENIMIKIKELEQ